MARRGQGNQRSKDHFSKKARKEGKPARSYYKLEEIDKKIQIFNRGQRVLDLGCSPGSWMLYAAERVGESGQVLGYDLKEVNTTMPQHAEARVGDVFELSVEDFGGMFQVIVSDMAPKTTGNRVTDHLRSAGLVERALDLALRCLEPGGAVVAKLLEGAEIESIVRRMRGEYEKVQRFRPKATRQESTEVFLVGLKRRNDEQA